MTLSIMSFGKGAGGTFYQITHNDEVVQKVNRVFAAKKAKGTLFKWKNADGKISKHKIPGLPDNCLVFNKDISQLKPDHDKLDLEHYEKQAFIRIRQFVNPRTYRNLMENIKKG